MTDPTTERAGRPRGRRFVGVLAVGLAGLLAGCSALGPPGAAAVVDGRAIGEADVQTVTGELREYLGQEAVTPALVLYLEIIREPVEAVAAERGLTVSPEQAEQAWLATRERPDGERDDELAAQTAQTLAVVEMYDVLIQDDQARAQLAERFAEQDVEVSPRYGAIDESREERPVVPAPPDWLRPGG